MTIKKALPMILLSYLAIYLIWGSTYLFIAYTVETIPPAWVLSFRFLLSGTLFSLIPLASGSVKSPPNKSNLKAALFLGFFLLIAGNGLVTFAEQTVDSYIAALIICLSPLAVALFNRIMFKQLISIKKLLGMLIGLLGVALLLWDGKSLVSSLQPQVLLIFIAITSWGFGTAYSVKLEKHNNMVFFTGIQMLMVGAITAIIALISSRADFTFISGISLRSWLSLLFLTFVGGTGIIAYNYLLTVEPTNRITSHTYVNPIIATLLGIWIRRETPTPFLPMALPLILLALYLTYYAGARLSDKVVN